MFPTRIRGPVVPTTVPIEIPKPNFNLLDHRVFPAQNVIFINNFTVKSLPFKSFSITFTANVKKPFKYTTTIDRIMEMSIQWQGTYNKVDRNYLAARQKQYPGIRVDGVFRNIIDTGNIQPDSTIAFNTGVTATPIKGGTVLWVFTVRSQTVIQKSPTRG